MRVLLCHTYYQQRGGEDQSFDSEAALLESRGHEVVRYTRRNDEIESLGRVAIASKTFWNRQAYREVRELIQKHRPDVMHCTNTFPLLSPSIYRAARQEGVAVVQSLRNYRQLCPSALLMRDGAVCEDCLGKSFAWSGVRHACYRESRLATAVVAGMTTLHRWLGTWSRGVDQYFTLSEFAKRKFVTAGWPAERITVKPNFIGPDPGEGSGLGNYAVFVGRLSPEKGLGTLLEAWRRMSSPLPLKIVGDGPLRGEAEAFAAATPHVECLGGLRFDEVLEVIGNARMLVMPSIWYETFGRTIIEAYAKGTPVVASNLGAMAELVEHERTGLLFSPGDSADLSAQVQRLWNEADLYEPMRRAARQEYLRRYTAGPNHDLLLSIYQQAIDRRGQMRKHPTAAAAL